MIVKDLELRIDSRVYSLTAIGWLSEIYKTEMNSKLKVTRSMGNVFAKNFALKLQSIWERRSNLTEIHLKIVYAASSPYAMPTKNGLRVTGYNGDLFHTLQEKLNFKYTLIENSTFAHGQNNGNGSFDGMIGMLQKGQSNWSVCRFGYMTERSLAIDFSVPISAAPKRIVTSIPKDNPNWLTYGKVFAIDFWLVLFISILILSFSLFLILKNQKNNFDYSTFALTFPIASICCREINQIKTSWAGKILIVFVLAWGFLISSAYNAILTSELAVTKFTQILSFEDLLYSDRFTLLLRKNAAITDLFKNAEKNETRKKIKLSKSALKTSNALLNTLSFL
jgi:hypothetical protein